MSKKNRNPEPNLSTGHKVINYAKGRGADVREDGIFTSIETPAGKMHVKDSNQTLDKQTQSNIRRWLRLLGLLVLVGTAVLFFTEIVLPILGYSVVWF